MPWNNETARAYAELGRQKHVAVLQSIVPELLGDLGGQRVLDFGCGPGGLTVALAEAGADCIVGIDESDEMVDAARALVSGLDDEVRARIVIERGNEDVVAEKSGFDAALSSLALMMCDSMDRLVSVSRALVGAIRPGGRLLVVLTHPCFRHRDYGTFRYELPEDYDYWRSGAAYEVQLGTESNGEEATITDHHWTLQDYCNALTDAGAAVTRLVELPAAWNDDKTPSGPPAYLALRLDRQEPNPRGSSP
ncbi:MAG: methyltransferase domain-containing protein [Thermoanaerobaculales bacterium]|jgi:SAM-dependent methyltransferase|nr:methyltransferase domain-containing protein [Thermoanaerobaculales bacterium]